MLTAVASIGLSVITVLGVGGSWCCTVASTDKHAVGEAKGLNK